MADPRENEAVREAREYAEKGVGGLNTLHLGPLDYNVATTADYFRTAALLLEDFARASAANPAGGGS